MTKLSRWQVSFDMLFLVKQRQMEKKQAVEGVKRLGRKRRNNHETQQLLVNECF